MDLPLIYCAGKTLAAQFCMDYLKNAGLPFTTEPSRHVKFLLLDVPSFEAGGNLRLGGSVENLLKELPGDVTICGGNLKHPALAEYRCIDFLQAEDYLARNAYITAECALDVAYPYMPVTLRDCPVLIIGWGRIGKCLGQLLRAIGADVTIAARKAKDRAMIRALGYNTADTSDLMNVLPRCRLIFNTAPEPVLDRSQMALCRKDCVKIELASRDGMDDDDVIIARGLPGVHMPESSGILIAETFLHYYKEEVQ